MSEPSADPGTGAGGAWSSPSPRRAAPSRLQLRDHAAEEVRRLIVSGEAAPGALLRLEPLAEHVETSVTPVREALLLLAQEGWVTQEPHRGFRVAQIRRRDVEDLHELHAFLFGRLAGRAAREIEAETVTELRALDREIRQLAPVDARRIEELNFRLHEKINAAADSPRLSGFARTSRFLPGGRGWAAVPGWLEEVRGGHDALLSALERRNAEAACAEMAEHIRRAGRLLLEHLEQRRFFEAGAQDSR